MTREITLNNGMITLVDDEDYDLQSQWSWNAHKHKGKYYAERGTRNRKLGIQKTIRMSREIMNAPEGVQVDHIDGNSLNNQKHNLRLCTDPQNKWNRGATKRNKSGYKGVFWDKQKSKWCASIQVNKKRIVAGFFSDKKEAAKAYNEAALFYHGEFARINEL